MPSLPTPFLVEVAIEPKSASDREMLDIALAKMVFEDPSFTVSVDHESGQTLLKGADELFLDRKIEILRRTYKVEANVGAPQVAYRETITCAVDVDHTHARALGGRGEFARVKIRFEPGEQGSGCMLVNATVDGAVPDEFIPGFRKGIESAADNGLLAGFPVIDFKATLYDGAYHDVDSSASTFAAASRAAFRQLRERGAPTLLEPIMKVEVVTPDEYLAHIIGDLNSRRGQIQAVETRGGIQNITVFVPLANMFRYGDTLRSIAQGRADFSMTYDHYGPVETPDSDPPTFSPAIGMRA
jgi:elongation factor G